MSARPKGFWILRTNTALTLLTTILLGVFGFFGREAYIEQRLMHDAVIHIQDAMVSHLQFDSAINDLSNRVSAIERELIVLKRQRPQFPIQVKP